LKSFVKHTTAAITLSVSRNLTTRICQVSPQNSRIHPMSPCAPQMHPDLRQRHGNAVVSSSAAIDLDICAVLTDKICQRGYLPTPRSGTILHGNHAELTTHQLEKTSVAARMKARTTDHRLQPVIPPHRRLPRPLSAAIRNLLAALGASKRRRACDQGARAADAFMQTRDSCREKQK
jgi:hypothetical protein